MPEKPKILTQRDKNDSKMFRSVEVDLEFSNGEKRTYEYLKSGPVAPVIVVPLLDEHTVLFVEEYAVGLDAYEWGLPKGRVDAGENHVEAADRELKEEAGYGAKRLDLLQCVTQSPNYMQHKTQIVLARDLYEARLEGDEPEPLRVIEMPFDRLDQIISHPKVSEARTIAALFLAKHYLMDERN